MRDRDRPSYISAKLIALEPLPREGKEITRIQLVIADEFEDATVELVRTGLCRRVEKSATAVVLSRIRALLYAELLQCIDRCLDECSALVLLAHIDTIEQEGDGASSNTADGIAIYGLRTNRERIA